MGPIRFHLNGQPVEVHDVAPTTTLLNWLREERGLTGTKEGCAEGDCGACSVAILDPEAEGGPRWRAVNGCLVLLPSLQGQSVLSVEGIGTEDDLHPAQDAMVRHLGSQCGYCTPGVVMTLFEATYRTDLDASWKLDDQLCGNLCRCTGYRAIRDAAREVAGSCPVDRFQAETESPWEGAGELEYTSGDQRFFQPHSFDRLFEILDANPDACLVAGATDLGLAVTKGHVAFPCLVDVRRLPGMRAFEPTGDGGLRIGAGLPLSELESLSQAGLPALARMLRYFASRQIKNRATLGGNLCNASPIGDTAPILMALGASVVVRSRSGERQIPLDAFFLSYRKTALRAGELLVAVEVPPIPPLTVRVGAFKVSKRRELDISAVSAGMWVQVEEGRVVDIRLCYGGMAATTKRAAHAEAVLRGEEWSEAQVERAAEALSQDFEPMDDQRGSAWFRQTLAANLLRGFFMETQSERQPRLPSRSVGTCVLPTGSK
jgi:xanthine dehydrogenase small subunit